MSISRKLKTTSPSYLVDGTNLKTNENDHIAGSEMKTINRTKEILDNVSGIRASTAVSRFKVVGVHKEASGVKQSIPIVRSLNIALPRALNSCRLVPGIMRSKAHSGSNLGGRNMAVDLRPKASEAGTKAPIRTSKPRTSNSKESTLVGLKVTCSSKVAGTPKLSAGTKLSKSTAKLPNGTEKTHSNGDISSRHASVTKKKTSAILKPAIGIRVDYNTLTKGATSKATTAKKSFSW